LPSAQQLGDEGAANHMRFAAADNASGIELFVYGRVALDAEAPAPRRFPARQTREASEAVARHHALAPGRTLSAQQHPDASDAGMLLVAPAECRSDAAVGGLLERLVSGNGPIREVLTFDLKQSMQNGGGPACLRLRVALTAAERGAIRARIWLDDVMHAELIAWVERHYRDRLAPTDLADPALLDEGRRALDELTGLLRLGSIYPFQYQGT